MFIKKITENEIIMRYVPAIPGFAAGLTGIPLKTVRGKRRMLTVSLSGLLRSCKECHTPSTA